MGREGIVLEQSVSEDEIVESYGCVCPSWLKILMSQDPRPTSFEIQKTRNFQANPVEENKFNETVIQLGKRKGTIIGKYIILPQEGICFSYLPDAKKSPAKIPIGSRKVLIFQLTDNANKRFAVLL